MRCINRDLRDKIIYGGRERKQKKKKKKKRLVISGGEPEVARCIRSYRAQVWKATIYIHFLSVSLDVVADDFAHAKNILKYPGYF